MAANGKGKVKRTYTSPFAPDIKQRIPKLKRPGGGGGNGSGSGNGQGGSQSGSGLDGYQGKNKLGLTPEQMDNLNAKTRLTYGGQTQALKQHQENVPAFFTDYRNKLAQLGIQNQAITGLALGQLGALSGQMAGGFQGISQAAQQAGASGQVVDDAAKAALVRQGGIGAFGGYLGATGQAEQNYLTNRAASSGPLQIQAQTAADQALTNLQAEKGAFRVTEAQAAKDRKQQRKLDKIAAMIAMGKSQAEIQKTMSEISDTETDNAQNAKDDAQDNARDRKKWARTPTKWGPTNGEWAKMTDAERKPYIDAYNKDGGDSGGGDDKPKLTPGQRQQARQESRAAASRIDDAIYRYNQYIGSAVPEYDAKGQQIGTHPASRAEVLQRLRSEDFTQVEIGLALRVRSGKPLTPAQRKVAKRAGVTFIPAKWLRKHHPQKPANGGLNPNEVRDDAAGLIT